MSLRNLLILMALSPAAVAAQAAAPAGIQDNSFLIEEAYNQEQGVVQHISTFRTYRRSSDFDASFTQEWPIGGITHQFSYDLPLIRSERERGLGDIRFNYRYQLFGNGTTPLAVSPRVSLTVPTGDWKRGRGSGAVGIETMLPISHVVSPFVTAHWNAGAAVTPSARNTAGQRATAYAMTLGNSFVLTANPAVQLLVETVYGREQIVVGEDATEWTDDLVISPGVRAAFNFDSGLQIVPGVAFPIGVGPSSGDRDVFFYLSFEHPFGRSAQR